MASSLSVVLTCSSLSTDVSSVCLVRHKAGEEELKKKIIKHINNNNIDIDVDNFCPPKMWKFAFHQHYMFFIIQVFKFYNTDYNDETDVFTF